MITNVKYMPSEEIRPWADRLSKHGKVQIETVDGIDLSAYIYVNKSEKHQRKVIAYERFRGAKPSQINQLSDECRKLELNPPTSYADVFVQMYNKRYHEREWRKYSSGMFNMFTNWGTGNFIAGPWVEKFPDKKKPVMYEYDIVSAYAWAGMTLPDIRYCGSAYRDFYSEKHIALFEELGKINNANYVPPCWRNKRYKVMSSEDGIGCEGQGLKVLLSFRWETNINLKPIFHKIIENITDYKAVLRAYWGKFAVGLDRDEVDIKRTIVSNGEAVEKKSGQSQTVNPLATHMIISRINRRIIPFVRAGIVYKVNTDSITTTEPIKTNVGDHIGGWKLKGIIDDKPKVRA